jgi:hypothetical protein
MSTAAPVSQRQQLLLDAYRRNNLISVSDSNVRFQAPSASSIESGPPKESSDVKPGDVSRRTTLKSDSGVRLKAPEEYSNKGSVTPVEKTEPSATDSNLASVTTDDPAEFAVDAFVDAPIDFLIDATDYFLGNSTPKLPRKSLKLSDKTSILIPEDPKKAVIDDSVLYK